MRRTSLVAALAGAALVLSACGSDDATEETPESSETGSGAETTTESGITVTGGPGEKPTLEIPDEEPPAELVVETLDEGDGEVVGADDFVVAHYLGQTWEPGEDGEANVFDNSYDRGEATGFSLNGVITGWKEGLTGVTEGSRVLLTIPPEQGYGDQDQEAIPAGSTLTFVVEVVDAVASSQTATGEPVADLPEGLPTVSGEPGEVPTLDFEGAAAPETSQSTLLIAGDGEDLKENLVVNMLQASYPDGADAINTWEQMGAQPLMAQQYQSTPGLPEAIEGQKVGSRILVQIAAEDNPDAEGEPGTPLVLLIDIVGTY